MSTLELLVLLGSVVIVAVVWLIPVDRKDRPAAAPGEPTAAEPTTAEPAAGGLATPAEVPVLFPAVTADAVAAAPAAPPRGAVSSTAPSLAVSTSRETAAPASPSVSTYPVSIPIPVAVSVARLPEPVAAVPARPDAPFQSSSASASSLTWSPHPDPADSPWAAPPPWRGSQSVVARVSAMDLRVPEDPVARRRLLLAAGAGFVVALAVAGRR